MTQYTKFSKIRALSTAAFCLFSSSAMSAAEGSYPSFARILELAASTNLGLDYVPFTPVGDDLIATYADAEKKLQQDPIYAQISAAVTFTGIDFSIEQTGAYLAMALDKFLPIKIIDVRTSRQMKRQLGWLSNFGDTRKPQSAKHRQQANKITRFMLALQQQAKALGITLDKCQSTSLNTTETVQNNLACILEGQAATIHKKNVLHSIPSIIDSYAVALDHVMLQLSLMPLLATINAADDVVARSAANDNRNVFVQVTESINAIRDMMSGTPVLQAQYAFMVSKSQLYLEHAGELDVAGRIRRFLPEIARGLALVKLNANSSVYTEAFNLVNNKFEIMQNTQINILANQTYAEAVNYKNKYLNASNIDQAGSVEIQTIFNAVLNQSLIKYLSANLKPANDRYKPAVSFTNSQQLHFGKYLPQAKIIAQQISAKPELIESLLWLIRLGEDKSFVAKVRDLIDHSLAVNKYHTDARRSLVSIQWFVANKDYVLVELLKLNPDLAKQVANTLVIAKTFNKENHGVISALFDAEDHSIEDKSSNLRRAGP